MRTIQDTGFSETDDGRRAQAIFDARIAPALSESEIGKHIVIDLDSGGFVLGDTLFHAATLAGRAFPDSRNRSAAMVGYAASTRVHYAPFCQRVYPD